VKVEDPAGETWRIKRRWLPWRPRKRSPDALADVADVGDLGGDFVVGLIIFVVVLGVLVFLPIVFVLAIFVAELFVLLLLLPVFILLRAGFVARWPTEAWRGDSLIHAEAVRGWGRSRQRMQEIVDGIRLGSPPSSARRPLPDGDAV